MLASTPAFAQAASPYRQEVADAIANFASDPSRGLTASEALRRLQEYGRNELTAERPRPAWRRLLAQFKDALVVLLMLAAGISVALWIYERESALPYEAIAIFSIVSLNALLGLIQESRAASSVDALKRMTAAHARVIRDGQPHGVAASEIVPGDIILLEKGDAVPADARVIQSSSLKCAEAALTGESLPVAKDTAPILWINLATDGAPALALGVDPPNQRVMSDPPRAAGEAVITRRMWSGIILVAVIVAIGVLAVLDASLPGGLISGAGSVPYAQTMAFTTMMLFQLFNVLNARSDEQSAIEGLFSNGWLWGAMGLALTLQAAVIYVPVLQQAFSTESLHATDWLRCLAVASSVLWLRELSKVLTRRGMRRLEERGAAGEGQLEGAD